MREKYSIAECYNIFILNAHLNKGDIMALLINKANVSINEVSDIYNICKKKFLENSTTITFTNKDIYPCLQNFNDVKFIYENINKCSMKELSINLGINRHTLKQNLKSLGFKSLPS